MRSASDLRVDCCPMRTQSVAASQAIRTAAICILHRRRSAGEVRQGWQKTRFRPCIQIDGGPAQSVGCRFKVQPNPPLPSRFSVALFLCPDIGESMYGPGVSSGRAKGHAPTIQNRRRKTATCLLQTTWGGRILTLHRNYVAGYIGPLLFLFERTQQLTPLTTRGKPWRLRVWAGPMFVRTHLRGVLLCSSPGHGLEPVRVRVTRTLQTLRCQCIDDVLRELEQAK